MNAKQIIVLCTGISSAITLCITDIVSASVTLPSAVLVGAHVAVGVLALVSGVMGAILQAESTTS